MRGLLPLPFLPISLSPLPPGAPLPLSRSRCLSLTHSALPSLPLSSSHSLTLSSPGPFILPFSSSLDSFLSPVSPLSSSPPLSQSKSKYQLAWILF